MKKSTEKWNLSPCFSELELRYAYEREQRVRSRIGTPDKAKDLFMSIWNLNTIELREEFCVVLLNNATECVGWATISTGGRTATIVDVSQVVSIALLGNATSVIMAHNHPSGILKPSQADIRLTNRVATALKVHDLELHDHLILTREEYFSFRAHDLIQVKPLFA